MSNTAEQIEPSPLDQAAYEFELAEKALKVVQEQRDVAMLRVLELAEVKEEGSKTIKSAFYKVTTTAKLNRTLDKNKLAEVQTEVSPFFFSKVIAYKPSLVKKELDFLENNEPEVFKAFMKAITVKPGKPSLKIEQLQS